MVSRISTFLLIALVLSQITTGRGQDKATKDEPVKAKSQPSKPVPIIIIEDDDLASRPTIYRKSKTPALAPTKQPPPSRPQYYLPDVPGSRNIASDAKDWDQAPAIPKEPIPTLPTKIVKEQVPFPPAKIVREQIPFPQTKIAREPILTLPTKILRESIPTMPARTQQREEILPFPQRE